MNTKQNEISKQLEAINDLHNTWVGLEYFLPQLSPAKPNPTYPPYNIERIDNDKYRIVIALAGFSIDRLNIELKNGDLIVKDIATTTESDVEQPQLETVEYIHHGIANRSFTLMFHLSPEIIVDDSKFVDGLLTINMHKEIPESKRPRLIKIN